MRSGEARGSARRLLASGPEVRVDLRGEIRKNRSAGSDRRSNRCEERNRCRTRALPEGTGRVRVRVATGMSRHLVAGHVGHGHVAGAIVPSHGGRGHVVSRRRHVVAEHIVSSPGHIVAGVPIHCSRRVRVAQNDCEATVHRCEHEARRDERAQHQHRQYKRRSPVPNYNVPGEPLLALASHTRAKMHEAGRTIKRERSPRRLPAGRR